jgi:hypothetical protein
LAYRYGGPDLVNFVIRFVSLDLIFIYGLKEHLLTFTQIKNRDMTVMLIHSNGTVFRKNMMQDNYSIYNRNKPELGIREISYYEFMEIEKLVPQNIDFLPVDHIVEAIVKAMAEIEKMNFIKPFSDKESTTCQ